LKSSGFTLIFVKATRAALFQQHYNVGEVVEISCCGRPRQLVGSSEFGPLHFIEGKTVN
jgi:hypothetical protein